jgi:hypothetical protein
MVNRLRLPLDPAGSRDQGGDVTARSARERRGSLAARAGKRRRTVQSPRNPVWGLLNGLTLLAMLLCLSLSGCGIHNPPLGPKPTAPPNAGPQTAPDGETPAQAAVRLFPVARAQEVALMGASPQRLKDARPGLPVPIARDYQDTGFIARWVLPHDQKAVLGNMFAAMWPIAMVKSGFLVPIFKHGTVVDNYSVGLRGDAWVSGVGIPQRTAELRTLRAGTAKLKRLLGPQTTVRPVVFVPSGLIFAVGDNQGREAAAFLGNTWMGPGIGFFDGTKMPQVGDVKVPAQLRALLAIE